MISDQTDIARALLRAEGGVDSPANVAAAVAQVWTKLRAHFTRLIGDAGIQAVLDRTVSLASMRSAWLAPEGLAGFAHQSVEGGVTGFSELLWTFVGLLGRFIGHQLVGRLLHEVWPDVFPSVLKELP
jgi:hypothetical protein